MQSELQSRIASLEASLLEAEALKTAAAEPETLAAAPWLLETRAKSSSSEEVVADLAEELQQRDSDEGAGSIVEIHIHAAASHTPPVMVWSWSLPTPPVDLWWLWIITLYMLTFDMIYDNML